jgi:hypothetical protein
VMGEAQGQGALAAALAASYGKLNLAAAGGCVAAMYQLVCMEAEAGS